MVAILEPITDVIYTMIHNITLHHTPCHHSPGYLARNSHNIKKLSSSGPGLGQSPVKGLISISGPRQLTSD